MSDLIDRQALRAAHGLGSDCHDCKRDMKSCQYDRDYSLMDFCEWLDDAPTIDAVEVRHGKWNPGKILSHEFVGNVCVSIDFEDWRCSICGIVVEQPNMPLYKYCPNCGAKMEVRDESAGSL